MATTRFKIEFFKKQKQKFSLRTFGKPAKIRYVYLDFLIRKCTFGQINRKGHIRMRMVKQFLDSTIWSTSVIQIIIYRWSSSLYISRSGLGEGYLKNDSHPPHRSLTSSFASNTKIHEKYIRNLQKSHSAQNRLEARNVCEMTGAFKVSLSIFVWLDWVVVEVWFVYQRLLYYISQSWRKKK